MSEKKIIATGTPFSEDQQQWLSGFFAGANTRLLKQDDSAQSNNRPLTIIYGTQTGNSESIGDDIVALANDYGLAAELVDMGDIEVENLADIERLLVICSTYGEGEMPDNAEMLWEAISEDSAAKLDHMHFSVLSLGDSSYDEFCLAGRQWDTRLAELGANRVVDRVDCDVDFDDDAEAWSKAALDAIKETGSAPSGAASSAPAKAKKEKSQYNRKNPFPSALLSNKTITGANSSKEIKHFEFSLKDSGLSYEAGDALNVVPLNDPELVDSLIANLGLTGDEVIEGKSLRDTLITEYEIKLPATSFLEAVAAKSKDEELNRLLKNGDKEALNDYLWGRDIIDFIIDLKVNFSVEELMPLLRKLQARAYSISSSSKKHQDEVHLTISSVRYESQGRDHQGVASCYLADRVEENAKVAVYFSPNTSFRVPNNPEAPMIMVGPGTGIAPFRAFLEERESTQAKGDNWLFFGDRKKADDFIYQDEIEAWQASGLLTKLDLAFSRDQEDKIYVQTRMQEKGAELFAWLDRGGYFFICGDAMYMAKDVDKTLHNIISEHGKMDEDAAIAYVNDLKKAKRYVRDVY
ncbi:MAG: sulfite reductase subunit alpha [Gammaproteobacteria bacterium]|nr:MAG: sulfite reductase subunit alpha [Gammaproteobacteria bacterium]